MLMTAKQRKVINCPSVLAPVLLVVVGRSVLQIVEALPVVAVVQIQCLGGSFL